MNYSIFISNLGKKDYVIAYSKGLRSLAIRKNETLREVVFETEQSKQDFIAQAKGLIDKGVIIIKENNQPKKADDFKVNDIVVGQSKKSKHS